jgi:fumarylacetoacetase
MDPTTDPKIRSFLPVPRDSHFPIQNLPFGVFRRRGRGKPRVGTRVGDTIVDLAALAKSGLFDGTADLDARVFRSADLNDFLALGRPAWRAARETLSRLLRDDEPTLRDNAVLRTRATVPIRSGEMFLPARIGDYTDFYSSREHATNVGKMFRGEKNALMPNWLHLPVAYHGRASSIVLDGTPIRRPSGQTNRDDSGKPEFGPTRNLDFELEVGFLVGGAENPLGEPIPIERVRERIFGLVLVNDWSARDIQKWEYQPLGPFNAKNFATSISPWVVTLDALEPFRQPGPRQDPEPFDYLRSEEDWTYDIRLEVLIRSGKMTEAERVCQSNFKHLYWTIAQQLAHHSITGCNLRAGDLLASGTISAPDEGGFGSLLELTWNGTRPIRFAGGEERTFLEDGDTVILTAWAPGDGYRVGFGEVRGKILPALHKPEGS